MTVKSAITDLSGNALDGDANGTSGGDWTGDFVVAPASVKLDPTFDVDGKVTTLTSNVNDPAMSVVTQSDGKIVTAGAGGVVTRYLQTGGLDMTFGSNGMASFPGYARGVAIQSDGKIVVVGYSSDSSKTYFTVARYSSDGMLDMSFGVNGTRTTALDPAASFATSVAIQGDGKIVVAGYVDNGGNSDFALARYTSSGAPDSSFGSGGIVTFPMGVSNEIANGVVIQSDGKIVIAGTVSNGSNNDFGVARLTSNGILDDSFGDQGKRITPIGASNDNANHMTLQSDGKIVVVGSSNNGSNNDFAVVRYTSNGTPDSTFGTGGIQTTQVGTGADVATSVATQPDGKIVVAGYTAVGSTSAVRGRALQRERGTGLDV